MSPNTNSRHQILTKDSLYFNNSYFQVPSFQQSLPTAHLLQGASQAQVTEDLERPPRADGAGRNQEINQHDHGQQHCWVSLPIDRMLEMKSDAPTKVEQHIMSNDACAHCQ